MRTFVLILCALALAVPTIALAQKAKEPITVALVQQDKATDFSKFKTYTWTAGHPSLLQDVDKEIIAAIESQLAAQGLTKAAKGDVLVAYHSVERTDVDLKTFDEKGTGADRQMAQTYRVGTLLVDLRNAATNALIWRAKAEGVTSNIPAENRQAFLNQAAAKVFSVYPLAKGTRK